MMRSNGWDRHLDLPSDVHSSDELATNIALAIVICVIVSGLVIGKLVLDNMVTMLSAILVCVQ